MPISTLGLREQGPHLSCGIGTSTPGTAALGSVFWALSSRCVGASGIGNRKSGCLMLSLRQ